MDASAPPDIAIIIRGPLRRADLPGLYARVCALLEGARGGVVDCQVSGIAADAVAIDALARLQLGARRHACRIRLRDASPKLAALIAFMGLRDVLGG